MKPKLFVLSVTVIVLFYTLSCGNKPLDERPASQDINELLKESLNWSVRMAETLMKDYPDLWRMEDRTSPKWGYTFGLVGQAFLKLWKATGDTSYFQYAKGYADALIDENGQIKGYRIEEYNIDRINPGKMLFTLYEETADEKYLVAINTLRRQLKDHPRTESNGFWHKKIYPWQIWLDGIYMGAPFYAQYGELFNEPENFDDIAHQILLIESKTRDAETGLLYHGWDESRQQKWSDPETGCSPNFWGRAMGWYAMALVDVLDFFPKDHPDRNNIIAVFQRLAEAIVKVQDPETGLWYQVLDQGGREGNYLEGSVSCMFAYSLFKAVAKGYVDPSFRETGEKAYLGIITHMMTEDEDGRVTISPVCAVAGLGGDPYRDGSYEYYINERKRDNDPKATGPFIMAGIEYQAFKIH